MHPENTNATIATHARCAGMTAAASAAGNTGTRKRAKRNRVPESLKNPPKVFASASAIGYYGDRGDEILTESSAGGNDFVSEVCRRWEASAAPAAKAGIRTVLLRIGVVLTPRGGLLRMLLPVFAAGLGGRIGSGRQHLSWIGIDDVAGAILHAAANPDLEGPVNLVSPAPVSNRDFAHTPGRVLSRSARLPVPASLVKTIFGQMGEETALAGTRVVPEKLHRSGYAFRHPDPESALSHVLGKTI